MFVGITYRMGPATCFGCAILKADRECENKLCTSAWQVESSGAFANIFLIYNKLLYIENIFNETYKVNVQSEE